MLVATKTKDIILLHYEDGKHITSKKYNYKTPSGKNYSIDFGGLFLPLQIYDEAKHVFKEFPHIDKKYLIPYGGDLFSFSIHQKRLRLLACDILGHGIRCHTINRHLRRFIFKHKDDDNFINKLNHEMQHITEEDKEEMRERLLHALDKLEKSGYPLDKQIDKRNISYNYSHKKDILENFENFFTSPNIAIAECDIDLDKRKIEFANLGNPSIYCILMDHKGNILRYKEFKKTSPAIGFLEKMNIIKDGLIIPNNIKKFRIVLFTDAILEQEIYIPEKAIPEALENITSIDIKKEFKTLLSAEKHRFFEEETLLRKTIQHLSRKSPTEFVNHFYKYLIHLNSHVQCDDLTLTVIDFEEQ